MTVSVMASRFLNSRISDRSPSLEVHCVWLYMHWSCLARQLEQGVRPSHCSPPESASSGLLRWG